MRHRYHSRKKRHLLEEVGERKRRRAPTTAWMRPADYFEARYPLSNDGFPVSDEEYHRRLEEIRDQRLNDPYFGKLYGTLDDGASLGKNNQTPTHNNRKG